MVAQWWSVGGHGSIPYQAIGPGCELNSVWGIQEAAN